uniref:Uncharacterized protein n=1 Tax=Arundo donax TaxID=35708 RepID=A0A0A8YHB9_ARUDO
MNKGVFKFSLNWLDCSNSSSLKPFLHAVNEGCFHTSEQCC